MEATQTSPASHSEASTVSDSLPPPIPTEPPWKPTPRARAKSRANPRTSLCSCRLAFGSSGTPDGFTKAIGRAMTNSGFNDTSPGGCSDWFPFCFDPTAYPHEDGINTSATVVSGGYTFRNGLHLGGVYEGSRRIGGLVGWNAQAGELSLSAEGKEFAIVAGLEKPFSRTGGFASRLHGRVVVGPAFSTVDVLASGAGANPRTSASRTGFLIEAGVSCRVISIFVLDLSVRRWQLGKYDVGPYTVTSGGSSQEFPAASVDGSHSGLHLSVGVRP